jgi:uncharacterized protein YggE
MENINNQEENVKVNRIFRTILWVLVIVFIISYFTDEHDSYRYNNIQKDTITVSGKGEVIVKPDIATVSFGVTAENMDVAKAQTESTTKMNSIIDLLKSKGVDIKSIYFNINGHHSESDWRGEFPLDYTLDEVICKGTEI